jgi:hypothetical protein
VALACGRLDKADAVIADRESGAGGALCQTYANHTNASREGINIRVRDDLGDHDAQRSHRIEVEQQRFGLALAGQGNMEFPLALESPQTCAQRSHVLIEVHDATEAISEQVVVDFRQAHHTLRDRPKPLFRPAVIQVGLLPQHPGDELEIVADAMLEFFRHHILLDQQRLPFHQQAILLDDQRLHLIDGRSQDRRTTRRCHRFGEHIGKASQEIYVMLIERAGRRAVDLEDTPGPAFAFDQDIGCRDDLVFPVEGRQRIAVVFRKVFEDHRFAGDEGATLRRGLVRRRHDAADDTLVPAAARLDQKIVVIGAVSADLRERYVEAPRANFGLFGQDLLQVGFPKRETAEVRQRRLLAQQPLDGAGFAHLLTLRVRSGESIPAVAGSPAEMAALPFRESRSPGR